MLNWLRSLFNKQPAAPVVPVAPAKPQRDVVNTYVLNRAGIDLVKQFEGLRLKAYKCPAGVWTIGYGHTGKDVEKGMVITEAQAEALLVSDLSKFADGVRRRVKVRLNSNQFSALVSLAFNIGLGAFGKSTLLRKLNAGWYPAVPNEIRRWDIVGGKRMRGLTRRRDAEVALWETPCKS